MSKKNGVSVKQLAQKLGLSQGTVSIVLNGRGDEMRISKATQARVLDAARAQGYQPAGHARPRGGAGGSVPLISLFCPYMKGAEPLGRVLGGIQRAILFEGLDVEVTVQPFVAGQISERAHMLSSRACSGAIVMAVGDTDSTFLQSRQFDIPIVALNSITDKYSSVSIDDYEAGFKVATLFGARGHKAAGIIMAENRRKAGRLRQLGFADGCAQQGITLLPQHVQETELSFEGGFRAAGGLMEHRPLPTCLFVEISDMAIGALPAFLKAGVAIPEDMELVTYGDNPMEAFVSPSLSTLHLPLEEMSCACVERVLKMIETGDWDPVSQLFPLELVIRESCGGFPE